MNEEDVRQKMLDIVGDIYNAKFVEHGLNGYTKFDGHTLDEEKYTINRAFDDLTIDHPKVKLPREVGEELDDWKKSNFDENLSGYIEDVDAGLDDVEKATSWIYQRDDTSEQKRTELYGILADAYRYGWEVEKPKRYVLPMEGTEGDETQAYASYLTEVGVWDVQRNCPVPPRNGARCQVEFTQADIDAAPKWVQVLERVEVTDDAD